jgi:hypothetical protein
MLRHRRMLIKFLIACSLLYLCFRLFDGAGISILERELASDNRSPVKSLKQDNTDAASSSTESNNEHSVKVAENAQQLLTAASSKAAQTQEIRRDTERNKFEQQTVEEENKADEDDWQQQVTPAKPVLFQARVDPLSSSEYDENKVTKSVVSLEAAIAEIQPLIDEGLIVPRWNGLKEEPGVPGGPGK